MMSVAAASPVLLLVSSLYLSGGCLGLFQAEPGPAVAAPVPRHHRASYSLYGGAHGHGAGSSSNSGSGRVRGRNWCARHVTRNVSCAVLNGSHSHVRAEPQRCRWGQDNCPGGRTTYLYRAYLTPVYKVGYKSVTELKWSCCPGFSGSDCEVGVSGHSGRPSPTPATPGRPHRVNGHGGPPRAVPALGERVVRVEAALSQLGASVLALRSSLGDADGRPAPPRDGGVLEALGRVDEVEEALRRKSDALDELRGLVFAHGHRIEELAEGGAARRKAVDEEKAPDYAAIVTAALRERGGGGGGPAPVLTGAAHGAHGAHGAVLNGIGEEGAGEPCGEACAERLLDLERRLEEERLESHRFRLHVNATVSELRQELHSLHGSVEAAAAAVAAARPLEEPEEPPLVALLLRRLADVESRVDASPCCSPGAAAGVEGRLAALDARLSHVERELTDGGGDGAELEGAWRAEAELAARRLDTLEGAVRRLAERGEATERAADAVRVEAEALRRTAAQLNAPLADGAEAERPLGDEVSRLGDEVSRLGDEVSRLGERASAADGRAARLEGEVARVEAVAAEDARRCRESCPGAAAARPAWEACGGEAFCLKLDSISLGLRGLRDGLTEHVAALWDRLLEVNGTVGTHGAELRALQGAGVRGAAATVAPPQQTGSLPIETLAGLPEGRPPYPRCAAFSAALTRPAGQHETVKFDRVLVNDGGHYDPESGIFQVPFDGRYLVSVTVSGGPRGVPVDALLAVSEEPLLRLRSPAPVAAASPAEEGVAGEEGGRAVEPWAPGEAGVASASLVVCLKAGQALYVENAGGAVAHGDESRSTFSAVLLYEADA
ncbi:EMILIN-1-like [Petromyzon marinus]|uniref:EMILIN-1-like n=1 Tax=Petromyzon marinus TaxID=7757 RepID=UPI003F7248F6